MPLYSSGFSKTNSAFHFSFIYIFLYPKSVTTNTDTSHPRVTHLIRGPFEKSVDSPYHSESEFVEVR